MVKLVTAALGLVVSMAVGAGLAAAHDKVEKPSLTGETIDSPHDPDVGSQAEGGNAELEGTLEVLHEDRKDGSSHYRHFLSTHDGKRLSLEGVERRDLLTGDLVRVRGVRSGQKLQLQTKTAEALQVLQYAPLSNTFGPQKTAVFLVNFADDPSYHPFTTSAMQIYVNGQISPFFVENSYQQTSLVADVFGWYTMPFINSGCPSSSIPNSANQAAVAAGVNLSGYTRRVYFFPETSCGWSGMASVGGNPSTAWLNGDVTVQVFSHELGHNLGLYHSHSMSCPPAVLGPNCTVQEYGDGTDTMGSYGGHFNPFQKQRLGWLDYGVSPPITRVQQSGTYTIDAYDFPGTTPKALKIQRGTTAQAFFVALRRTVGFDKLSGVFVHLATDGDANSSYLLDMTPETPASSSDGNLDVGKSFTDPVSGITIKTVSVSSTSATIMVDMGGTGPSCTRSAPSVTGSPAQSPAVQPGTMVTYNVSVTNTDSTGCSASSFTLQATAPAGWQKSLGAPSLTINPGATLSTTLRVTSPIVPPGSYTIVGAATSSMASTLSRSTSVLYDVASGGSGTPGTFTDKFDRPDSPVLGNDWSVITGSLMIQSGEARNQANKTLSLAVQPGLMGVTQTVEASFASTNNNSGPRFGVVVRYRDPQNYYVCYRQAGGSSLVRIAKVQNGVETVLKSVGVGNPALNVFSTLSCQVSGSTLTLRVDGATKLSATDGTFSTGSVGYAISSQKAGSHRADNFSAIVQ
jgi:hypothetical protein